MIMDGDENAELRESFFWKDSKKSNETFEAFEAVAGKLSGSKRIVGRGRRGTMSHIRSAKIVAAVVRSSSAFSAVTRLPSLYASVLLYWETCRC